MASSLFLLAQLGTQVLLVGGVMVVLGAGLALAGGRQPRGTA